MNQRQNRTHSRDNWMKHARKERRTNTDTYSMILPDKQSE